MDREDALDRAVRNTEAAEQLLAVDDELTGPVPGGFARHSEQGPYGVYEQQRDARVAGATARAAVAQAWAAIAPQLPTRAERRDQAAVDRRHEIDDRRSRP
jgi:hypothetical protein